MPFTRSAWELLDKILNAVLFMLIDLEMLVLDISRTTLLVGAVAIVLVLMARWVSPAVSWRYSAAGYHSTALPYAC